jgi:hypothetical protein
MTVLLQAVKSHNCSIAGERNTPFDTVVHYCCSLLLFITVVHYGR